MPALLHAILLRSRVAVVAPTVVTVTTVLTNCGDDNTAAPTPAVPVGTVSIVAIPTRIFVGETIALSAEVRAPTITSLAPAQITAGWSLGFTLTITGTGFTSQTRIVWDNEVRETQFVGATTLRITVTPADVRTAREVSVVAETPGPEGGRASTLFLVHAIPVDRVDVQSPWGMAWTWVNNALPLVAVPRSATGAELPDRRAHWSSDNTAIASVVATGDLSVSVYGVNRGATSVQAVVDGVSIPRAITVHDAPAFDIVYSAGVGAEQYLGTWSPTLGQAPRRLPIDLAAFEPSPSPSGDQIVFAGMPRTGSVFDANVDLYVVTRDGGGARRLTTDDAVDHQPSWSPAGTQIAFTSTRGGNRNVWVINDDGTNLRRLTDTQAGTSAGDVAWSPEGSRLVYGVTANGKTSLWIMDADGANQRPLTLSMDGNAFDPTWSPNGQLIAFRREFGSPTQVALTFVSATDGTTAFPVLNVAPMSGTPAFSPDGEWLIASSSPLGNAPSLYAIAMNRASGPRVVLPATLGGARAARWMRRP